MDTATDPTLPDPFPGHDPGVFAPVPGTVAASWPVGTVAENLAVAPDGRVFVSLHSHQRVDCFTPATGGTETFAHLSAGVAGLTLGADGTLWVAGGVLGQAPGIIWRVTPDGNVTEWAQIPDAVFLNGSTLHPDGRTLLVCESMTGRVVAVDTMEPAWRVWVADDRLAPVDGQTPGANGIKRLGDAFIVSVTGANRLVRLPVAGDGSASVPEVFAENLRADDFAVAASGALFIATHPAQSVLRLGADGSRRTIAGPAEGAIGATSCAFGRAPGDAMAVYVTTTGGVWSPYRGEVQAAKLLRLDVGEGAAP